MAPFVAAIFTFASHIIDYLQLKTGERYEGLVTSVSSMGSKVGTGLGAAILGWGLDIGGYDGSLTVQAQSSLDAETFLLHRPDHCQRCVFYLYVVLGYR